MTEVRLVSLSKVLDDNSDYVLFRNLAGKLIDNVVERTLKIPEIDIPIVIREDSFGKFHIIDGFKRFSLLNKQGASQVPCIIFPADISEESVLSFAFLCHKERILRSVSAKARFVSLAFEKKVSTEYITSNLLPALKLEPHSSIIERLIKVSKLPADVLAYCSEKGFSLKQLFHLTCYPASLVERVFSWKASISLSASLVEELLDYISCCLKAENLDLEQFCEKIEIESILMSKDNSNEKTKQLIDRIRKKRFPVLNSVNSRISDTINRLSLPDNIQLNWDRTLESKNLSLKINIKDYNEWRNVLSVLTKDDIGKGFSEILNEF